MHPEKELGDGRVIGPCGTFFEWNFPIGGGIDTQGAYGSKTERRCIETVQASLVLSSLVFYSRVIVG